jgi:hypothetical protein
VAPEVGLEPTSGSVGDWDIPISIIALDIQQSMRAAVIV